MLSVLAQSYPSISQMCRDKYCFEPTTLDGENFDNAHFKEIIREREEGYARVFH